jgi:hypothetical protein
VCYHDKIIENIVFEIGFIEHRYVYKRQVKV